MFLGKIPPSQFCHLGISSSQKGSHHFHSQPHPTQWSSMSQWVLLTPLSSKVPCPGPFALHPPRSSFPQSQNNLLTAPISAFHSWLPNEISKQHPHCTRLPSVCFPLLAHRAQPWGGSLGHLAQWTPPCHYWLAKDHYELPVMPRVWPYAPKPQAWIESLPSRCWFILLC